MPEDLLVQRGITVSYETIRQWCRTFGPEYARTLRRRRGEPRCFRNQLLVSCP